MRVSNFHLMRHLAARFVKSSPNVPFVLDPYWDMRSRFSDLERLKGNIRARKLQLNVEEIARSYGIWWEMYCQFYRAEQEARKNEQASTSADQKRSVLKKELLELRENLIGALRLPNDLVLPSTSHTTTFHEEKSNYEHLEMPAGNSPKSFIEQLSTHTQLVGVLRQMIENELEKLPESVRISPPRIVRQAIVEACNLELERFPSFFEGDHYPMVLAGISLPTMLATFANKQFLKSKKAGDSLPVRFIASGASYFTPRFRPNLPYLIDRQHEVISVLILSESGQNCIDLAKDLGSLIQDLFENRLKLPIDLQQIQPHDLRMYENRAYGLKSSFNWEISRLGFAGTYLSERCAITCGQTPKDRAPDFVHIAYAEIDIDAIALIMRHLKQEHGDWINNIPKAIGHLLFS